MMEYNGSLYGTTSGGGVVNGGTLYKVNQAGVETILHAFGGYDNNTGYDASEPRGIPIVDNDGNMYGTTVAGGTADLGTVYKIDSKGRETLLHSFQGGNDGQGPECALLRDSAGNLYGTTTVGGAAGFGTIFKLTPDGTETIIHTFTGATDGQYPIGGLLSDQTGNLYGTANYGGPGGNGSVFKLSPSGAFTVLHGFTGGKDGGQPYWVSLISDTSLQKGYLFGTTAYGGKSNQGVVFRIRK